MTVQLGAFLRITLPLGLDVLADYDSGRAVSGREIGLRLDLTPEHVSSIGARFRDEGVAGLHERPEVGAHRPCGGTRDGREDRSACDVAAASGRDQLDAYMRAWNKSPTPFAWTKAADAIIKSHHRMLKRISTAVH
jgi:hypothetical protein